MNESQIRSCFYSKFLSQYSNDKRTLIVNELGLKHGKCRADIAVINGNLTGYEIKSDLDSVKRLDQQIQNYSFVFNHAFLITSHLHLKSSQSLLPNWWGIILAKRGNYDSIDFEIVRKSKLNPRVDDYSVAQLLWHKEVYAKLVQLGLPKNEYKKTRSELYLLLIKKLNGKELRNYVKNCLLNRVNWRCL